MRTWMLGLTAALAVNSIAVPRLFQAGQAATTVAIAERAPAPWLQADPADSLYRVAREALNRNQYRKAADTFAELGRRYPRSGYAADALYWEAFALYRLGGENDLRTALGRLETQKARFPKAGTSGDAVTLTTRIQGELARRGDAEAAATVTATAGSSASGSSGSSGRGVATTRATGRSTGGRAGGRDACDDDDDVKLAALNAVLQMDSERAMPLLTRVLARRDSGSVCLRRKAVFLVAQKADAGGEDVLIGAARNDPDGEVREQAVFWLSQVESPKAVAALDSIVQKSTDVELQEKAVFALSQQRGAQARSALRAIAERKDMPRGIREKAIFWLGQSESGGGEYLRGLYARLDDDELKDKVIFGVAQSGSAEDRRWLLDVAKDPKGNVELRKKAVFWLGQAGGSGAELASLYGSLTEAELKEQVIFALSQLDGPAAVDQLMEIARKDKDPEMRKKAIFWLGQSDDPRASQFIEQLLTD
ncbi:MAG: HEAT repeat domain-containing protein [Gemmatimonadetes bacterium]|nr:HEAT repeat domain-containing protein [Gemmatimonadota bacterium]MBP9198936.1 HEAT repeat domain-containing protein [Gemmatimonadales bacterium]